MNYIKFNSLEDLKKEGKSFYWGSFFLPRKLRKKVATLYSICRYCDNVADNDDKQPPKLPIGVRTADTITTSFII